MTSAATGQHRGALNLVLLRKALALFRLVVARRGPVHFEYLALRSDKHLGLPVTLQTPLHLKRSRLICQGHQVESPVTGRAADPLVNVNAMVEINKVGQVVNTCPFERLAVAPALTHRFQVRAVRPNLRVTIHAGFGGRDPRIRKFLNRGVTIAAVDALIADVMFVAELNWLFAGEECLGIVRGPVELEQHPDRDPDKEHRPEDGSLRDEVRTSIEDLAHRFPNR